MSDGSQIELSAAQYAAPAKETKASPDPVESTMTIPPQETVSPQVEYSLPNKVTGKGKRSTAMATGSEDHKYVSLVPPSVDGIESDSHKYTVPHKGTSDMSAINQQQELEKTAHRERGGRWHHCVAGVLVVFLICSIAINIGFVANLFIGFLPNTESEALSLSTEYTDMLSQLRQDVVNNVSCNDTKLNIIESLLLQVANANSLSSGSGQVSGDLSLCQEIYSLINVTQENTRLLKHHIESSMISSQSNSDQLNNISQKLDNSTDGMFNDFFIMTLLNDVVNISNGTNKISQEIKSLVEILNNQHVSTPILLDLKSCQDIRNNHPNSTSGYYFVNGTILYCEMGELNGSEGGWTRLAYLDMNDSTVSCPDGFRAEETEGIRACARDVNGCSSVKFPSYGVSYSEVSGRVVGYQFGDPEAHTGNDIDSAYLDGISITYGSPRQHIWSLIAGPYENKGASDNCPCNNGSSSADPPQFVGDDYFCESGNPGTGIAAKLYATDPLWDGAQCGSMEVNCCSAHPGLPWFHKTLSSTTSDFLELRNCGDDPSNENIYISFYEIFVK